LAGLAISNQKVGSVSWSGFTLMCAGKEGIVQVFAGLAIWPNSGIFVRSDS